MDNDTEYEGIIETEHPHFLLPQVSLRDIVKPEFHEVPDDRKPRRRRFGAPVKGQTEEKVKKRDEFFTEKSGNVATSVKKHRLLQMLNNRNPRETIEEIRKEVDLLLQMDNKAVAADLHSALEKTEINLQSGSAQK